MNGKKTVVHSAIAGLLAMGMMSATQAEDMAGGMKKMDMSKMEKCYGIVKAGKNDCKTSSSSCAGTSEKDNKPTAFLAVPKGTCERITGGNLEPKAG